MTERPQGVAFERVIVRLGLAPSGESALEAGLGLAAALGAALEGLFVEDANLLRIGALPFATETSTLTGMRRNVGAAEIERALRVAASRHERRLAESASRTRVRWAFAVTRGDFLGAATARGGDLIVVGPYAVAAIRAGPVVVVHDASPEARRARDAAARLATAQSRGLVILVPGPEGAARRTAVARARRWLDDRNIAGLAVPVAPQSRALAAALRAHRGAILALPLPMLTTWPLDPEALAADLGCPLVIAR